MPIETRFKCSLQKDNFIKIDSDDTVIISLFEDNYFMPIYLDVPTAIKLSKSIRTEINKIKGGKNG